MTYTPNVNDYVKWNNDVEGWVYFKCDEYVTIEMAVRPKNDENYKASPIHANERLLVLCYRGDWKDLSYVRARESIYEN
jgi:hypothetical protein